MDEMKGIVWLRDNVFRDDAHQIIHGVHREELCQGRPCCFHNPSMHHMRDWPATWRQDKGVVERTCPHGVGHTDPDNMWYLRATGDELRGLHGCDGCCVDPTEGAR